MNGVRDEDDDDYAETKKCRNIRNLQRGKLLKNLLDEDIDGLLLLESS